MDDIPEIPRLELVPLPEVKHERREDGTFEPGSGGKQPRFVMEPEIREKMIQFMRLGARRAQAALSMGVSRQTFHDWTIRARAGDEPYVTFIGELDQAEAFAEMRLLALWSNAAPTSWQASRDLLRVRFRERWDVDEQQGGEVETGELVKPHEDVEHLSEIMAAYEEAEVVPHGHRVAEADG